MVEDEFVELSVVPGGTPILRPLDAIAFVRRCRELRIKVLGLDGFHLIGDAIRPDMGESIDLSVAEYRDDDSWDLAEAFLRERIAGKLYFEVVADEYRSNA